MGDSLEEIGRPIRHGILNAYYFPEQGYDRLYESITPVNTFRVVFSQFFGMDYELLPDRNYKSNWKPPFEIKEITEQIQGSVPVAQVNP